MSIVKFRRSTFITTSGAGSIIDFRTRNGASVSVIIKSFDGWENKRAKYIQGFLEFPSPPPQKKKHPGS